ncbi:MAG: isoleucine--tRNA ligase [Oscillospiraceae bacterium]|jgi:isoleucyl-tRNA synthetase|nr:isoleucine--tRNA ligase [Oscillospiraceae bacterium]
MKKYNSTLNLPKTDFPMKAQLPIKELDVFKYWQKINVYQKMQEKNSDKSTFVLHDGPPYANGEIHLGHALNKILKDMVVKFKNMSGFKVNFVPGWDTHGLPTELKSQSITKNYNELSDVELRDVCSKTALNYLEIQRESFKRLGIFADWENPYITLEPRFEAKQIEVFAELAKRGAIYRGLRPVYWCSECRTALAEAEIEYNQDACDSIYVKFQLIDDEGKFANLGINNEKIFFVIWTTTVWSLPGNVAICVNSEFEYSLISANGEFYVIASKLVEASCGVAGIKNYEVISIFKGSQLENIKTQHPFLPRVSKVILGDHVTVESGTGCVHTAPGHGIEDFEVCKNYGLEIPVPVNDYGYFTEEAGEFANLKISSSDENIIQTLKNKHLLFAQKNITHKYPHCWRCKKNVIFRATNQWFCSVSKFKDDALKAIANVNWIPVWGEERMKSMLTERNDWCISRQRKWGVPLPIFFCLECGEPFVDYESMLKVSKVFEKEGSNSWFANEADYFLSGTEKCSKCGSNKFKKEKDIMDVWFDSGSTHHAVLSKSEFPADIYLEGADQYRGWFQSSLLTSVGMNQGAPYKTVITHGWVVDDQGKKQSKSLGNVISPSEIISEYGADILRLWVASVDYTSDVKVSKNILSQISESYRKIRNTARFILGNLYDFCPKENLVSFDDLLSIDKWILLELKKLIQKCFESYENFEFYAVFHAVQSFCILNLSNFYLDILKDRLYTENSNDKKRRSAQTAMWYVLKDLVKIISPIISFTAEEIWSFIPKSEESESVFLNDALESFSLVEDDNLISYWRKIMKISDDIKINLEKARQSKIVGSSLEAQIIISADKKEFEFFDKALEDIKSVSIVSDVKLFLFTGTNFKIDVKKAPGRKCERCWMYSETVGKNNEYVDVCDRCVDVLKEMNFCVDVKN